MFKNYIFYWYFTNDFDFANNTLFWRYIKLLLLYWRGRYGFFSTFILTIISIDFYLYINIETFLYLIYSLSIITYFGILIYDFYKKKITKKDFIIYFLYFFIDIALIYFGMTPILRNFSSI